MVFVVISVMLFVLFVYVNGGLPGSGKAGYDEENGMQKLDYVHPTMQKIRPIAIDRSSISKRKIWCSASCNMPGYRLATTPENVCDYLVYSYYSLSTQTGPKYECTTFRDHAKEDVLQEFRDHKGPEITILEFGHIKTGHLRPHLEACDTNNCGELAEHIKKDNFKGAILSFDYVPCGGNLHSNLITMWTLFSNFMRTTNSKWVFGAYMMNRVNIQCYKIVKDFLDDADARVFIISLHLMNQNGDGMSDATCPMPKDIHPTFNETVSLKHSTNSIIRSVGVETWEKHQLRIAVTITLQVYYCKHLKERYCVRGLKPYRAACADIMLNSQGNISYDSVTDCGVMTASKSNQFASGLFKTKSVFWNNASAGIVSFYFPDITDDDYEDVCGEKRCLVYFKESLSNAKV